MYPLEVLSLSPPFPRRNEVFVAISFAEQFEPRWQTVIEPGIKAVKANDVPLRAVRVDTRVVSDSILTEILRGIGSCAAVLADISSEESFSGRPVRNGNVMYEVGIAHASRLPEEVVLFRSDSEPLLLTSQT